MSVENIVSEMAPRAPLRYYAIGLLLILVLPWLPVNPFVVYLAQTFAYTAIAVIGLNLLLGLSGQMSLGQAGFYALGAYGSALVALKLDWPVPVAILFGTVVATAAGALVGIFALRTRGLYLAMATMVVGFVIEIIAQRWVGVTGGSMGLTAIPQIELGAGKYTSMWFLYFAGICLLVVQIGADYINDSFVGRRLRAVRESETFAASVGIQVTWWRAATFAGCAGLAGLGGALFAHQSGYVGSDAFSIRLSISLLIAAVIGGLGARTGPLLGTLILLGMVEFISGIEDYGLLIHGGILLGVLIAFPKGAAGILAAVRRRLPGRSPRSSTGISPALKDSASLQGRMQGAQLSIVDVSKSYSGVLAVDKVSIQVKAGDVHGLIGPNGAGKSTLINIIAGIYRCDAGTVLLDGQDITALATPDRARIGLARTFQNLQLIEAVTALQNVQFGFVEAPAVMADFAQWWRGIRFEEHERSEALAIMDFLGIADLAQRLPGELSYGHRKLLELARAIAQRPRIMLLDEPIAGLNAHEAREIASVVKRLRSLGITIIVVEHNMEFVMSTCDAISVLDYGQLIVTGTPEQVQKDARVLDAYLGKSEAEA